MNHLKTAFYTVILIFSTSVFSQVTPQQAPLLQKSNITYIGAFSISGGDFGGSRFGYGGEGLSFFKTPAGKKTLFMQGHAWYPGFVAQIEVPSDAKLVKSNNVNDMNDAAVLQNFYDVSDGKMGALGSGSSIYGMLPFNGRLIVAGSVFYDAGGDQVNSHGVSGFNLSDTTDFKGFYPMQGVANPRSKGGYMTIVPSEWRTLLGGPALTGKGGLPIISANGCGPCATVFNPNDVGNKNPIPATTLLFYPLDHPLYNPSSQNPFFNLSTTINGIAFPAGSRSILFFGKHGTGPYCYGCGCSSGTPGNPSCTPDAGCPEYCYDPAGSSKGTHAFPYVHKVWAYDANDFLKVKNGEKQSYEIQPYAMWQMDEMDTSGFASMVGAAYDPETGRLYIAEGYGEEPHIHVYQVNVPNASTKYTLTINNGTGSGSYPAGTVVAITANVPSSGTTFDKWAGNITGVGNVLSSSTSVNMPAANIIITATYKIKTGLELSGNLKIYPNPASDWLHITGLEGISSINVCDVKGMSVLQHLSDAQTVTLDVSGLNTGMYFVMVKDAFSYTICKISKE